eukprot:3913760-Rhodomonas_salina.3
MGRPAKLLLVDYFSKSIWYQLGTFEQLDEGHKGFISRDDVLQAAQKHFGATVAQIYVDNVMRAAGVLSLFHVHPVTFEPSFPSRDIRAQADC